MNRRAFLTAIGASASATLAAACDSQGPHGARRLLRLAEHRNESVERWLFSRGSRDRVSADAALTGRAFPSYFISDEVPTWDPAARGAWRLDISGAVRHPMTVSLDELAALRSVSQRVDHFCVEGWNARAEFTGVRMAEIARLVEPLPDAAYVDFRSFDQAYHESWDLESALHPQTLVAYARDGRFLNAYQGAPARLHSPVKLGYKNTKYLTHIVFMPERNGGYWSDRGYEWYGGT
jgi:DMSO/TMAO reductase YedYZ molybdopterin-dependent catalytic subunit